MEENNVGSGSNIETLESRTPVSFSSSGGSVNASSSETELNVLFSRFEEKINNFEIQIEKINNRIENQKLTIIETIGIFVALFTFISIDFQVFKSYRNPFAISGLSLILLGSISFLLILFDFYVLQARAINSKIENSYKNKNIVSSIWERIKNHPARVCILGLTMILITAGVLLFHYAKNEDFEDMKNEFRKEESELIRNDIKNETAQVFNNQEIIKNNDLNAVKKCVKLFGFTRKCFE